MKNRLSIITVCLNSAQTIRSTIISVLGQNYSDFEYIIIDGGSSDGTSEIIKGFNDARIKLISEVDHGLWDAMNKAVTKASGDFVTFLNSDDVYMDEFVVTNSLQYIDEKNLDLMFGFVDLYDEELMSIYRKYRVNELSLDLLKIGVMPAHPGSIIKRTLYNSLDGFHYNLNVPPDFYMFLSVFRIKKVRTGCYPSVLVNMRRGGLGNSSIVFMIKRQFYIINALRISGINVSIFRFIFNKISYRKREFFC